METPVGRRESVARQLEDSVVAGFRVIEYLDHGWTADVYRAEKDGRAVALKLYLSSELLDPKDWARVQREEHALKAVTSPNLCGFIAAGEAEVQKVRRPFVAMELIDGESLDSYVRRTGQLDWPAAKAFMRPLLDAVRALHRRGIRHRDIKPTNIRIERGTDRIVLVDLGLSIDVDAAAAEPLTKPYEFLGPIRYAAPEYIHRDPPEGLNDSAIDVYGLGCTLYFMLAGQEPFAELTNRFEIARAQADRVLAFPEQKIPRGIRATIRGMVSKKADFRPTVDDCIAALGSDVEKGEEIGSGTPVDRLRSRLEASDRVRLTHEQEARAAVANEALMQGRNAIHLRALQHLRGSPLASMNGLRQLSEAGTGVMRYRNSEMVMHSFPGITFETPKESLQAPMMFFAPVVNPGDIGVSCAFFLSGSPEHAVAVRLVATEAHPNCYVDISRSRFFAGPLQGVVDELISDIPSCANDMLELAADANDRGHPRVSQGRAFACRSCGTLIALPASQPIEEGGHYNVHCNVCGKSALYSASDL